MLEIIGKLIGGIVVLIFGKLLIPVGVGIVQVLPWYVTVIIIIIIISMILPVLKIVFQAIRFILGKIFK